MGHETVSNDYSPFIFNKPLINNLGINVAFDASMLLHIASLNRRNSETDPLGPIRTVKHFQGPNRTAHPRLKPFTEGPFFDRLTDLNHTLTELGTTAIVIAEDQPVIFDGISTNLTFVAATGAEADKTDNMSGGKYWIRDQAFIAEALMFQGLHEQNPTLINQGKKILTSLLFCMRTPSQLKRFDMAIARNSDIPASKHPSIKFDMEDTNGEIPYLNLETNWSHNQDAWQILASITLKAYSNGLIDAAQLLENKDFFIRIPRFLHAIKFLERSSAGSWEEISSKGRLSSLVWEVADLIQLRSHAELFGFNNEDKEQMTDMIEKGAKAIIKRFPSESAEFHNPGDPEYRVEDAALLYVGLAEIPEMLHELGFHLKENPAIAAKIRSGVDPVDAMYMVMFETVDRLKDEMTGGYGRYAEDSYQNSLFWTSSFYDTLNGQDGLWHNPKYEHPTGLIHYEVRGRLADVVNGYHDPSKRNKSIARWMHPNTQAASIAFRRANQTNDPQMREWYLKRGIRDAQDSLRMITGTNEYTIKPIDGNLQVAKMPEGVAPECIVTNITEGEIIRHVGPWGPLFWSAAGMRHMLTNAQLVANK